MFRILFRWIFGNLPTVQPRSSSSDRQIGMNEGDFHSGPAGYSPNTPYVETQYGSGFDEEADWAEGEH